MSRYFEDFEAMSTGAPPTGWTRRMTDTVWTTNVTTVNSQKSVQWANGGNPGGTSMLTFNSIAQPISGAVDLLFQFRVASTPSSDPLAVIYGDSTGTLTGYCMGLLNGTTWNIYPLTGGSLAVAIGSNVTFTISNATDYWCHFGVDGSGNFAAKMWAGAVSSEPGGAGSAVTASSQCSGNGTTYTSGYCGQIATSYQRLPSYSAWGFGTGGDIAPSATPAAGPAIPILTNQYRRRR